jgi:MCP family monocarboxylic acid transporter-like MFS transporter 10
MISGSIIYVVSMFMVSLVQPGQYYQAFLSQGVGMGIGQGMLFLPALTIVSHHFRKRKALATGIVVTGASAGGIVFPIMLNKLGERFNFVDGIRAGAALVAVLLVIANCIMRPKLQPKKLQSQSQPSPSLATILTDAAYLTSVFGAFLANLGLFFPCKHHVLYIFFHVIKSFQISTSNYMP